MKLSMFKILKVDQEGSMSILLVVALMGISAALMLWLKKRVDYELRYVAHEKYQFELDLVKKIVSNNADCDDKLTNPCKNGTVLALQDVDGGLLASADGSRQVAAWNIKAQCSNSEYQLFAERRDPDGRVLKDPLTQKLLTWQSILNFKKDCEKDAKTIMVAGVPCYACDEGTVDMDQLPDVSPEFMAMIKSGNIPPKGPCTGKACVLSQRPFPDCPAGFDAVGYHVDRYGWAGIDFTKFTICRKQ